MGLDDRYFIARPDAVAGYYARRPRPLPLVLRERGYRTHAAVNDMFMLGYSPIGFDVGFERLTDYRYFSEDTPRITEDALRFIRGHKDERFFLFLNYNAPHSPYAPPKEHLEKVKPRKGERLLPAVRGYLGEVSFTDQAIGQVMQALEEQGLTRRTLIIVTSDHGESLDPEHDFVHPVVGHSLLYHHGESPHDEVLRVPWVWRLPGVLPAGHVVKEQVRQLDLAPTILDLVAPTAGTIPGMRGKSAVPLITGKGDRAAAREPERVAYARARFTRSIRAGGWKYIRRDPSTAKLVWKGQPLYVPEELYNVVKDPDEHTNLAKTHKADLERMREQLRRYEAWLKSGARDLPAATLHLRLAADGGTHRLQGIIRVRGQVRNLKRVGSLPEGASRRDADAIRVREEKDGQVIEVSLATAPAPTDSAPPELGLDFETDPAGAAVELELALDDRPLEARSLLTGPFGLSLLKPPFRLSRPEDFETIASATVPYRLLEGEAAVIFWRNPSRVLAVVPQGGAAVSAEVERMLRDWGYADKRAGAPLPAQPGSRP
jgi:hypothetical protein